MKRVNFVVQVAYFNREEIPERVGKCRLWFLFIRNLIWISLVSAILMAYFLTSVEWIVAQSWWVRLIFASPPAVIGIYLLWKLWFRETEAWRSMIRWVCLWWQHLCPVVEIK